MRPALVALGGAGGALLRWWIGELVTRWQAGADVTVAWATVVVNALGAFGLGALLGADVSGHALLLLGTGLCGALTTFSALAHDVVALGERRRTSAVAALLGLHATLCLGAGWAGLAVGAAF